MSRKKSAQDEDLINAKKMLKEAELQLNKME
jgi:hypothetical protein